MVLILQENEYLLQEASNDGLCSYVIAAPMTKRDVYSSLFFGIEGDGILRPAGFSILPDNPNFESSLVTFAVHQLVNVSKSENDAIHPMKFIIHCMIQDIQTEMGKFFSNSKKKKNVYGGQDKLLEFSHTVSLILRLAHIVT